MRALLDDGHPEAHLRRSTTAPQPAPQRLVRSKASGRRHRSCESGVSQKAKAIRLRERVHRLGLGGPLGVALRVKPVPTACYTGAEREILRLTFGEVLVCERASQLASAIETSRLLQTCSHGSSFGFHQASWKRGSQQTGHESSFPGSLLGTPASSPGSGAAFLPTATAYASRSRCSFGSVRSRGALAKMDSSSTWRSAWVDQGYRA